MTGEFTASCLLLIPLDDLSRSGALSIVEMALIFSHSVEG